ncbi:MAG: UDP-N-acetylglucosamine 2-epimerase (non-hydrolyzing), partial [Proteobacteria bacterium]
MRPGQSLGRLTARLLVKLESALVATAPNLVIGHGDTTSCLAAAMASFYQKIPFFHVEAGLRSGKLNAPYPEEFNRRSVAPLATHHFANSTRERENLLADGIDERKITVTGSTIEDALYHLKPPDLRPVRSRPRNVMVTLHRREGLQALDAILEEVALAAEMRPEIHFLCPLHPNPAVRFAFHCALGALPNVSLTDPMPYANFLNALSRADLVITDSGGVQEEAALLCRPVLLARDETERSDGIKSGLVALGSREPKVFRSR